MLKNTDGFICNIRDILQPWTHQHHMAMYYQFNILVLNIFQSKLKKHTDLNTVKAFSLSLNSNRI